MTGGYAESSITCSEKLRKCQVLKHKVRIIMLENRKQKFYG